MVFAIRLMRITIYYRPIGSKLGFFIFVFKTQTLSNIICWFTAETDIYEGR